MSRNKNRVTNLQQFQDRSEELKRDGYVAVSPSAFINPNSGAQVFSWNDYVRSMLFETAGMTAQGSSSTSSGARRQISTIFASSGGENKAKPNGVGTPGLGYMEWGVGNRLPNLVWILSRMSPFTAAGVDFIKKILVGHGPSPKYHYTQYVGGNITEKYIPYASAGTLLRPQGTGGSRPSGATAERHQRRPRRPSAFRQPAV